MAAGSVICLITILALAFPESLLESIWRLKPEAYRQFLQIGQGFSIGSDTAATLGLLELQTGTPPFGPFSFEGGFTISAPFTAENMVANILGQITADGASHVQGIADVFTAAGTPNLGQTFGGAFNLAASGQGQMTTNTPADFPTNLTLFLVSPANFRGVSTDSTETHPEVIFLDH